MSKLFISHSNANNTQALALAKWLEDNGWDDYFLDISKFRGLSPGERWQAALKAAAHRCEAVIFLISRQWLDSKWCIAEFLLAQNLGKNIFGVLIEDLPLDSLPVEMTGEWQLSNLVKGDAQLAFQVERIPLVPSSTVHFSETGLTELRIGLQKAGLEASSFPWPPDKDPERIPYRGLKPYQPEDAAVFFGRDASIVEGLDQLRQMREKRIDTMLVVLGASGSGKSSFMRAGLWPRLKRDDRHFYPLPIIRPKRAVVTGSEGLVACLEEALKDTDITSTRAQIRDTLSTPQGLLQLLEELLATWRKKMVTELPDPTFILCIDQFEEIYSPQGKAESETLLQLLQPLLAKPGEEDQKTLSSSLHLLVIATIRTDLYENMQVDPLLKTVGRQFIDLTSMDRSEYKTVITGPEQCLQKSGTQFSIEPQLTEQLLKDTRGADALPLLAFTLERLFIEYGSDDDLRLDEYHEMGGVTGVIEAVINKALDDPENAPVIPVDSKEQKRLLREAFIPWLAEVDELTGERRRRIAQWQELPEPTRPLIERLITTRLLIRDSRASGSEENQRIVEVAHEALLRRWPDLVRWLDEDEEDLKTLNSVKNAAQPWYKHRDSAVSDEDWLDHKGERLHDAERLLERPAFRQRLGEQGRAYIKRCREHEDEQAEKDQKALKKYRRVSFFMACFALLMFLAASGAFYFFQEAEKKKAETEKALHKSEHNYGLSLIEKAKSTENYLLKHLYSLYGVSKLVPEIDAQVFQEAVIRAQTTPVQLPVWQSTAPHHNGRVTSIVFAPDGKTLASASDDNTIRIWNLASGKRINILQGHRDDVNSVAFAPDGTTIASASNDNTIGIWDLASGKRINILQGHRNDVNSVAFAPDDKTIASASDDNTIGIWNLASGKRINILQGHRGFVNSVAFAPGGKTLASASDDNTIGIWNLASGKRINTLQGHRGFVNSVAFAPDGKTIASASDDNTIGIWDLATGKRINILQGSKATINSVAFSPDGKTIASASDGSTIEIWDMATGKRINILQGSKATINSVVFAPDGKTIASASDDNTIGIWDLASGKRINILQGHRDDVNSVAFSPDGKTIASASDDSTIEIWDLATGKRINILQGHQGSITDVEFAPDGKTIASASLDDTIGIWDLTTGERINTLQSHQSDVFKLSVTFAPNGKTIASTSDGTIEIWDLATSEQINTLQGHQGFVNSVEFSPDGKTIASASWDDTIGIWDMATGERINILQGHQGNVTDVKFSPDGKTIASASNDDTIGIWNLATGKRINILQGHQGNVNSVEFSPDEKTIASASDDNTIGIWDLATGKRINTLQGHQGNVNSVEFSPDGKTIASASDNNTIETWDLATSKLINTLQGHRGFVRSIEFSPDGTIIASASDDNTIGIWNLATGKRINILQGHRDGVNSIDFAPDGTIIASASDDNTIGIWNLATGKRINILQGHRDDVNSIDFAPDSKTIASASLDDTIGIWDLATGERINILQDYQGGVNVVAFSPDGKTIASASGYTIGIWDMETGRRINTLRGHQDTVISLAFSPDGKTIASASYDDTIRIWDMDTGRRINTLRGHQDTVISLAFSPDGKAIASASWDDTIGIWDMDTGKRINTLQAHQGSITDVAFSPDGKTIASASRYTIGIWNLEPLNSTLWEGIYLNKDGHYTVTPEDLPYKLDGIDLIYAPPRNLYPQPYSPPKWSKYHPFYWLPKAERGDIRAMVELGLMYERSHDDQRALSWYHQAAKKGNKEGKQRLRTLQEWLKSTPNISRQERSILER